MAGPSLSLLKHLQPELRWLSQSRLRGACDGGEDERGSLAFCLQTPKGFGGFHGGAEPVASETLATGIATAIALGFLRPTAEILYRLPDYPRLLQSHHHPNG
jgi:hypothetical protein